MAADIHSHLHRCTHNLSHFTALHCRRRPTTNQAPANATFDRKSYSLYNPVSTQVPRAPNIVSDRKNAGLFSQADAHLLLMKFTRCSTLCLRYRHHIFSVYTHLTSLASANLTRFQPRLHPLSQLLAVLILLVRIQDPRLPFPDETIIYTSSLTFFCKR